MNVVPPHRARAAARPLVLALAAALAASPVHAAPAHAVAATPADAAAAPALTDTLRLDPAVRTGVLANGLRYFIRPNARPEKRVELRLVVDAGSNVEADDQRGFAHFVEHMNFNGSEHFRPDELVEYLRSIGLRFGADANAYTSFDETVYMLQVPTDRDTLLDRGLLVLRDFAGGATMTTQEIEKERGVVLEEWRLGRGAGERMFRRQFPELYHGSRYADRLPIGLPEIIRTGSADRLRAYYRDWYTADRMALVAVGDIEPARMDSLIRVHFATLKPAARPRGPQAFPIPIHRETRIAVATDREATNSVVSITFKRPGEPTRTVADERRDLVEGLFTSMLNARFAELAQRADAPFLGAFGGGGELGRSLATWRLSASTKDGGIERGLQALLEESERVRRHGFLPAELQRAKDRVRAANERAYAERDKSESGGFAADLVGYALTGEPSPGIEAEYRTTRALLDGITLDEVVARAPRLMPLEGRVVLASAPEKPGVAPPDSAGLQAVVARVAAADVAPWTEAATQRALMDPPTPGGSVKARRAIPALGATVLTLSNGVEVWLKPTDFKADEILLTAHALGGTSVVDSSDHLAASLAPAFVGAMGVGGFKASDLGKMLSGRILRMSPYGGGYTHGLSGSARRADLETALQMAYLTFTKPTRDPDAFTAMQRRYHAMLEDRANSPEQVFADTVAAVNTGRFYMSRTPTPADIDALDLDHLLALHTARYANAADFTFVLVGSFQVDSVAPLLARYLGALPSAGRRTSTYRPVGPRYPSGVRSVEVHKGTEPKASTRITFFTNPPIEELDQHRARAAASILTDRLRESLREMLSGTYSVGASFGSLAPVPGYATMTIAFGCAPGRVDSLVDAALAEVRRLREQGPSAEDVRKEQEVERRELEVSEKENGYWLSSLVATQQLGWDPLRILHRRERIERLTPALLRESYRAYFPLDRRTVITLLPDAAAAPTE